MPVNENVTTACFCASGWLHVCISRKRFLAGPWWYLVQWTLKMNSKLNLILWLRKLQIKWATKLRHHVLFTTQHSGLHNQIVQDGISSLANNVKDETFKWEWSKENLRVPFSNKDLFWNSKCYVMSEDISNSLSLKHRQDIRYLRYTKNHSLLNLRFSCHKCCTWSRPGATFLMSVTSRMSTVEAL